MTRNRSIRTGSPAPPAADRGISPAWALVAVIAAVAAVAAALLFSEAAGSREPADPQVVARWALPTARTVHNLALATVLGALVFASVILPRHAPGQPESKRPESKRPASEDPASVEPGPESAVLARALVIASAGSVIWTLAALAVLVFTCADMSGIPVTGADFPARLIDYMVSAGVGRVCLAVIVIALLVSVLTFTVRSPAALALTALLTVGGIVPLTLIGPAVGGANRHASADTLLLHITGASLWAGGIIVLALISGPLTSGPQTSDTGSADRLATVAGRFSVLAGAAFVLVLGSGILNVLLRLDGWDGLSSDYGALVGIKATAALALGAAGYLHRSRAIPALSAPSRRRAGRALLWRLLTIELVVMAAVSGIAVALARTPAPPSQSPEPPATPARILTGYDLPPRLEVSSWLTQWRLDLTWLIFTAVAAAAYLAGIRRLHRQGRKWPAYRTVCWLTGLALLLYITCGAATIYGPVLFSVHTGGHLALAFIVSLLLVLGTPLALLEQTARPRRDGSLGLRALAEAAHSGRRRWMRHPAVCAMLLVGSFIGFYYSPAFRLVLQGHIAHEAVEAFFVFTGAVFYSSVLLPVPGGRDDGRAQTAAVTAAVFCLWTAWLALSNEPIQAGWFASLGRDWGPGPVSDQQGTALVVWLIAALPPFLVAGWVALRGGKGAALRPDRSRRRPSHG